MTFLERLQKHSMKLDELAAANRADLQRAERIKSDLIAARETLNALTPTPPHKSVVQVAVESIATDESRDAAAEARRRDPGKEFWPVKPGAPETRLQTIARRAFVTPAAACVIATASELAGPGRDQASELRELCRNANPAEQGINSPLNSTDTLAGALALVEALDNSVSIDCIQKAMMLRDWISEQAKRIDSIVKERALAWVQFHKQDVTLGPVRYYAGAKSETTCMDKSGTIQALLDENAGDFDAVVECLASDAFKHGAAQKRLKPETYGRLFKTEKNFALKEGKPVQQLIRSDDRYTAQKQPAAA